MSRELRYIAGFIAAHVLITPILVLFLLDKLCDGIKAVIDWAVAHRRWAGWLFEHAEDIEAWAKRLEPLPEHLIMRKPSDVPPKHRRRSF